MTISNENGDLLEQAHLKHDPFDIQFAEQKVDEKQITKENTVSINMGHLTILMYNMTDTENPVELAFQPKYGDIAAYKWFGGTYITSSTIHLLSL
jgi:WD repeat-containing protein 19